MGLSLGRDFRFRQIKAVDPNLCRHQLVQQGTEQVVVGRLIIGLGERTPSRLSRKHNALFGFKIDQPQINAD